MNSHFISSAKILQFLQMQVEKLTQKVQLFAYMQKKQYLCSVFEQNGKFIRHTETY